MSTNNQEWKSTSTVNEPSSKDVEVVLPFQDPAFTGQSKKPIIDYYQKNILPQNPMSKNTDSQFDLSGMKINKNYEHQPPPSTNNTSSPYFDKFLKVLMPS